MKRVLFVVLIFIVVVVVAINIIGYIFYGGYASSKSEEKYFRNLNQYHFYDNNTMFDNFDNKGDTLAGWIAKAHFHEVFPFWKWTIKDVGLVRPNGKLHKALDSMCSAYINKKRADNMKLK